MKEVNKSSPIKLGKSCLLDIWKSIKEGKNPTTISKELKVSKQALNRYLSSLKNSGLIEKIGYGTWKANEKEVNKIKLGSPTSKQTSKQVRGHAFVWKVKIPKQINWKVLLETNGYKYELVNRGTPRIMIKGKKVWLAKENVIIYDLESYFGGNSIEAKKYSINRLLEVLYALEHELNIDLKQDNQYFFQVARNHYSLIKNCLAIQMNKENKKIQVSNSTGMWFIIDNSYNLDEAETIHPQTALPDNLGIQKYFNEHKETNFQVTPKFILNAMNGIQQNQLIFDKNMKSHLEVLGKLGKAVDRLGNTIKKEKTKQLNNQTKLGDF